MNTNTKQHFGLVKRAAACAVSAALVLAPAAAFAQTALANDGQAKPVAQQVENDADQQGFGGYDDFDGYGYYDDYGYDYYDEGCYQSNEEYVAGLMGLDDAERAELVALYDKWDALPEDGDLSDAEWDRVWELEDKAYYAELGQWLTADEVSELKALYDKYYALPEGGDLSDAEWERIYELEDKAWEAMDLQA